MHHLSEGKLILPEHVCEGSLYRAASIVNAAPEGLFGETEIEEVEALRRMFADYQSWSRGKRDETFPAYCHRRGSDYRFTIPIYYG